MFGFFERFTQAFPTRPIEKPPQGIWAFCKHYSQGMWRALILVSALSACIAVMEVALYGFLGQLVDWFASHNPNTLLKDEKWTLMLMGSVTLVLIPTVVFFHSIIKHQSLMGNFPMAVRWQAHRYLLGQSLSFYQSEFAGRVATKVMQTALSVRETVSKLLDLAVYVGVYFFSVVALVFSADWRLAMPLLIWLAVYVSILRLLVPRLKEVSQRQADARSMMTGRIVDSYTNISTVKLFSHSQQEANYAKDSMTDFLHSVYPQMRLVTVLEYMVELCNALLIFSVGALSVLFWTQGTITPGEIAIAISLCLRLNGISHWIMWEVSSLFENLGTVQDGINTLANSVDVVDQDNPKDFLVSGGKIEFNQVQFFYPRNQSTPIDVFKSLNLSIKAGEKVGIVGRSGTGKSTLVNLLLRFYDVQSGEICIDEQNIAHIQQEQLRAQISMVTQDTSLMHRSVRDNIMYGRQNATEQDMIWAAKQAEAHEFILSLSDKQGRTGYDTHVGERGITLSGGQRQRIAIARVLLKDAPILILDEATSALDSQVEAAIQACLNRIMQNKTVLAIAHRLSTIAEMDRLIVLDNGMVVESGSHTELLTRDGIYAKLWNHQTGGFLGID